jgi:hypothetical protein
MITPIQPPAISLLANLTSNINGTAVSSSTCH